jgi:hypothetical protein
MTPSRPSDRPAPPPRTCLQYVLPWHQDRLDIFHVGIAHLDSVGQVVLVPSFDLNMQQSICLAYSRNFENTFSELTLQLLTISGQNESACQRLRMHSLQCIPHPLVHNRFAYEGVRMAATSQVLFMFLTDFLDEMNQ